MKNLFLNKTDEELKIYFRQFQAWKMLGVITDDELGKMRDLYVEKLGKEWHMIFIIHLLMAIGLRWENSN